MAPVEHRGCSYKYRCVTNGVYVGEEEGGLETVSCSGIGIHYLSAPRIKTNYILVNERRKLYVHDFKKQSSY